MRPDLSGKTAIVTGAGRGIGAGIARALAACGAHVVLAARTRADLEKVAGEISAQGGSASVMTADVTEEAEVRALFAAVGGSVAGGSGGGPGEGSGGGESSGRLDILVNNAGIGIYGHVADFAAEDLDRMYRVNLRGMFLCSREAMRLMIPAKRGYIISVASVLGFKGYPNQAGYTASKHGVMGVTKSLAVEAQEHGIRVSAVLPGAVYTELAAAARPDLDPADLLHPDDVAGAVLYLLSLSDRAAVDEIYIRRRKSSPF